MLQRPGTADEFAALVAAVTMALTYPGDRPLAPTGPSSPLAR
jgi:hypothetical protein